MRLRVWIWMRLLLMFLHYCKSESGLTHVSRQAAFAFLVTF